MSSHPATILIIDDIPDNISVLNGVLRQEYKIKAAPSGQRGLELARQVPPPDLILLDVMMPELDGYEVCRRLKADPATSAIPVLFITARSDEEDEAQGLAVGAADYITKPIRPAIVRARIKTHLKISKLQQELEEKKRALELCAPEV
jgi:putative two-component system response regulator